MSNDARELTTDSTPGDEPFAGKVDEATEYYRRMLYGDEHYYGPALDVTLRDAVRQSLAEDGSMSIERLCQQLDGSHPSDFDTSVTEGLRDLIWEASPLMVDGSENSKP